MARGGGGGLFLTATEAVLTRGAGADGPSSVVRLRPLGANPDAPVVGLEPLATRVNSYVGDRSRWREDVPTYGRVAIAGAYPGIDVEWYGADEGVEYDFVVAPGADPGVIRLGLAGADSLAIDGGATWWPRARPGPSPSAGPWPTRTSAAGAGR
ncbi:MAG: hypothetical protein ABR540_02860 [Acidimicrobiales bacterium]